MGVGVAAAGLVVLAAAGPRVAGWRGAPVLGGTGLLSRGAASLAARRSPAVGAFEIDAAVLAVLAVSTDVIVALLASTGAAAGDDPHPASSETASTWPRQT